MNGDPMYQADAHVRTPLASRFLQQLCKHFEHRRPVTFTPKAGRIEFIDGVCTLSADSDMLTLSVAAWDDEGLSTVQDIVARHLARFAFREPLDVVWESARVRSAA